jgi:hypothetical protein
MIQTQTLEFSSETEDERAVISCALWLIGKKRYDEAAKVLVKRHDELTKHPELKLYVQ